MSFNGYPEQVSLYSYFKLCWFHFGDMAGGGGTSEETTASNCNFGPPNKRNVLYFNSMAVRKKDQSANLAGWSICSVDVKLKR